MTSNTKETFGANLRRILESKKFKQTELAATLGIATNTVQAWIKGKALPTPENLDRISEILNIEVSELFIRNIEKDFEIEQLAVFEENQNNPKKQMENLKELSKRYAHVGAGDNIHNFYVQPVGKVLPGISSHLIELLQMANIQNSNDKNYYLINTLLAHIVGDKANDSAYIKMVMGDKGINEEFEFRKKQLARIAAEIAGLPDPSSIPNKPNLIDEIAQRVLTEAEHKEYMGSGGAMEFMRILKHVKEAEQPFITSTWFNNIQDELAKYATFNQMDKIKKNLPSSKKVSGDNN